LSDRRARGGYAINSAMGKAGGIGTKRKEPARANGVRQLRDLVGGAGGACFHRSGFVQHSIVTRWAEIVGERYSGVTAPEAIRFPPGLKSRGVLALVVESAHATMIQHVAPTIVERVNRFFGYPAVERVSVRQGRIAAAAPAKAAGTLAPLPEELGDSLRTVADPELRAVLESLARGLATEEAVRHTAAIPVIGTIGVRNR
jgi:hypothetical protein